MADWRKGDLALCVDDSPSARGHRAAIKKGGIYTVSEIVSWRGQSGLELEDIEIPKSLYFGFAAKRFRKVTPPKADEFDREIIALMARVDVNHIETKEKIHECCSHGSSSSEAVQARESRPDFRQACCSALQEEGCFDARQA